MQVLTITDLRIVLSELLCCSKKWYYIGLELDFSPDILDIIENESKDTNGYLLDLLKKYLRWSNPYPTWKNIVAALRSKSVGYEQLADEIERKHCGCNEIAKDSSTCKNSNKH